MQTLQGMSFLNGASSFSVWKSTVYLVLGGLSLYYGANFLISGAISISREWGVSERVISISVVAVELAFGSSCIGNCCDT